MGLIHTAAILSRETKDALSYLTSLAPKFFTARLRVGKQSFFSLSGQYGCLVNKPPIKAGTTCWNQQSLIPRPKIVILTVLQQQQDLLDNEVLVQANI